MLYIISSILIVAIIIVLIILLTPIWIEINSIQDVYRIRWGRFVALCITSEWKVYMKILGLKKYMSLEFFPKKESKTIVRNNKRGKFDFSLLVSIVKTFQVKHWDIHWNTGDMALNGKLFPVFYFISAITGRRTTINFIGESTINITFKNSMYRILKAYIRSY